jgi:hypothetical protein
LALGSRAGRTWTSRRRLVLLARPRRARRLRGRDSAGGGVLMSGRSSGLGTGRVAIAGTRLVALVPGWLGRTGRRPPIRLAGTGRRRPIRLASLGSDLALASVNGGGRARRSLRHCHRARGRALRSRRHCHRARGRARTKALHSRARTGGAARDRVANPRRSGMLGRAGLGLGARRVDADDTQHVAGQLLGRTGQ